MSSDTVGGDTRRARRQNSSGNNHSRVSNDEEGPNVLFSRLSEAEYKTLPRNAGFLHGFTINGKDGPRRSTRSAVKLKDNAQLPNLVQDCNNMITEIIPTKTDCDANFAHQGWPTSELLITTPWIASRIAKSNQPPGENAWVTKRTVVQRLTVSLVLQDLVLTSEFEEDVLAAMGKPSRLEKFQALDQVFQLWGDVIPLAFDIGTSLSITDLQANFNQSAIQNDPNELHNTALKAGRISTQGGEASTPGGDTNAWVGRTVPPHLWSQVRVIQVTPITSSLKPEINEKLVDLYSTLLSYRPPVLGHAISVGQAFDGGPYGLKRISSLIIHADNTRVLGISVVYADGTNSGTHGICGTERPSFILNNGEYIVEVVLWADQSIYGLQFTTSDGRISPHYGGTGGQPTILSSEDGVLVGFSGYISTTIQSLQTIWRHNLVKTKPFQKRKWCEYVGGNGGRWFNDWPCLQFSTSAYISSVSIRSSDHIINIQITYADNIAGEVVYAEGPAHGWTGGTENIFKLEPGEHIVSVQGRQDGSLKQLCFTTSFGRTSDIYGGNKGNPFMCQPPRSQNNAAMRLSYIAGKCGWAVDGVLFYWVPI